MYGNKLLLGFLFFILAVTFAVYAGATPNGAGTVTTLGSSSANASNPGNNSAVAGNVTELDVYGYSTTQSWQGYYGNVSGTIQLATAGNKVMYNWSIASPSGEIYASTNSSIQWPYVQCFNFTANGSYGDDKPMNGSTSLLGTNLTQLEGRYGLNYTDVDGVNETFGLIDAGTHNAFYTGSLAFAEGECPNTRVFSSAGKGEDNKFEEVLMYEPETTSVIFASILNKDLGGFDAVNHDFEMLVLENGHAGDISTTPYFFFVELE
jgi:hypothetical protein